mgnify:CR=1 FL=1
MTDENHKTMCTKKSGAGTILTQEDLVWNLPMSGSNAVELEKIPIVKADDKTG